MLFIIHHSTPQGLVSKGKNRKSEELWEKLKCQRMPKIQKLKYLKIVRKPLFYKGFLTI